MWIYRDYVEISADVKDFELSFTATIVTPGLFSEIEDSDLSDADDLTDSMKELMDATDELVDGTDALHEGAQTFQDYMGQYLDGIPAAERRHGAATAGRFLIK